ncbi:LamG-like jellyroll fold domain-containing protein [Thermodesulfobacteriota bacterium]
MQQRIIQSVITCVCLSMLLCAATNSFAALDDGLVAYYPFNGNANDASGNGNHGTVTGAALTTDKDGNFASAYSFDGIDDYIDIGTLGNFGSQMNSFSISIWMNTTDTRVSTALLKTINSGDVDTMMGIDVNRGNVGKTSFHMRGEGDAFLWGVSSADIYDGAWHHIVWNVKDAASNDFEVYVDGGLDSIGWFLTENPTVFKNFEYPLTIGAGNNRGTVEAFYGGAIDEVRIYNRALAELEIQQLYQKEIAQSWIKTYGTSTKEKVSSIQEVPGGGFVMVGNTGLSGADGVYDDFLVIRTDANGNIIWQNTYGGSFNDAAFSVRNTPDGNFVVAGYDGSYGAGKTDFMVMKIAQDGSVLWGKTYGGSDYEYAYFLQVTQDDGYVVVGFTDSFGLQGDDVWILKLDAGGNILWQNTYGGTGSDQATCIQQTQDGGYIVAGFSDSQGLGVYNMLVMKLDAAGLPVWQKIYGGLGNDYARSVVQTQDGGYIVAGYTESFGVLDKDSWVVKLDANGNPVWQRTYGGSDEDIAHDIHANADGGYIVAGGTLSFGNGNRDIWLIQLDAAGTPVWQKTYGGSEMDNPGNFSVVQEQGAGYIVTGFTDSFGAGHYDFLVMKLDAEGDVPGCDIIGSSSATISNTLATVQDIDFLVTTPKVTVMSHTVLPQNSSVVVSPRCLFFDSDDDGRADENDNCPDDFNPGQEDFDENGIGDVCDDFFNAPTTTTTVPDTSTTTTQTLSGSATTTVFVLSTSTTSVSLGKPSNISLYLYSSTLTIGSPVKIEGKITDQSGDAISGALIEVAFIRPDGVAEIEADTSATNGSFDMVFTPDHAGEWTVVATWQGNSEFGANKSREQTLTVGKANTRLVLYVSSSSIRMLDTVAISGYLDPITWNRLPLDEIIISFDITGPDGEQKTLSMNAEASGMYVITDLDVFDMPGQWTVQTVFKGNEDFYGSRSEPAMVQVRSTDETGYAVLVQGRVANGEGGRAHRKTVQTVYDILLERNIREDNIKVFGYGLDSSIPHETPSKEALQEAIRTWAFAKLHETPAPLYLVFFDHGNVEKFYIYPEVITPQDVDGWASALEDSLAGYDFVENPVCILIGACASGSFIPELSQEGRLIITSAAEDESSFRGPLEDNATREGSYFFSEFFKAAGRGSTLRDSFKLATGIVENWSRDANAQDRRDPVFHDEARQHPLIDDNGDGAGHNVASPIVGEDGAVAMNHYLGAASRRDALWIEAVSPPVTLAPDEGLPQIWVEFNAISRVGSLWLEIKSPGYVVPEDSALVQSAHDGLVRVPADFAAIAGQRWYYSSFADCEFREPGAYEIFFFVTDNATGKTLPLERTVVYRNSEDNQPPQSFDLIAPDNGTELNDSPVLFDWEAASDPDGDSITYSLIISGSPGFDNETLRVDQIRTSAYALDIGSSLEDGRTYYWKIEAVDQYGAVTPSHQVWQFYKDFNNILVGVLEGYVRDAGTGEGLTGVRVTSDCGAASASDEGEFFLICPEGSFTAQARLEEYSSLQFPFAIYPGDTTYADISLSPEQSADDNGTCVFERILHDNNTLTILRSYRDTVLLKMPEARSLVKAYYRHATMLKKMILSDGTLKNDLVALIHELLPIVHSLESTLPVSLLPRQHGLVVSFIGRLQQAASDELKAPLQRLQALVAAVKVDSVGMSTQ